jgi:hypothetical protein
MSISDLIGGMNQADLCLMIFLLSFNFPLSMICMMNVFLCHDSAAR